MISPTLFALYIDDLITDLNSKLQRNDAQTIVFADDVIIIGNSEEFVGKAVNIFEEWSSRNNILINKNKSAILQIRLDGRTPAIQATHLEGIPVKNVYNYLGVWIDDSLNFHELIIQKRKME